MTEAHTIIARMIECSSMTRKNERLIKFVISQGRSPKYFNRACVVLFDPVSHNRVFDWATVLSSQREFSDIVTHRIRNGYLPLGFIVEGPSLNIFADIVPEKYRDDFIRFASAEMLTVCNTLLGNIPASESWLSSKPIVVYGSVEANEHPELFAIDPDSNPRNL